MILVSACLLGVDCKYNGKNNKNKELLEFLKDKSYIPICPEQLGGLSTPRKPNEIIKGNGLDVLNNLARVKNIDSEDLTFNFIRGAEETLKICKLFGCKEAILKARSPSCGSKYIYNGEFNGTIKEGIGVTAALLKEEGITVLSEENYEEFFSGNNDTKDL